MRRKRSAGGGGIQTVRTDGLRLVYRVLGRGPVCLVPSPGWGMSVDSYFETLGRLGNAMTLVFVDSRGSGLSTKPRTTKGYRYADFARDMERVRCHLGVEKVWIFGHSMGGILAMRYALDFPASAVGLFLVGTFAQGDKAYAREVARREAARAKEAWYKKVDWGAIRSDRDLKRAFMDALPLYFHDSRRLPEYRAALASTTFSGHAYRGWQESEEGTVRMLAELDGIRCPTLVVVGKTDFVCAPFNSERIHRHIAGSRLVILPNTGHFPWLESPAAFYAAVDGFLAKLPAGAR